MSKFNTTKKTNIKTTNLAGGSAFEQNPKEELAALVATSFLGNQYYRTETETLERIKYLIDTVPDKKFVAKAAIWGRHTMGMRSISHVLAAYLAPYVSGTEYGVRFYSKVPRIGQDATEILSAYINLTGSEKMSMAMKKGLKIFLEKLDIYSLQKYLQLGKDINLFDLINLTHAKSEAISELKKRDKAGTIEKVTTEAKISKASIDGSKSEAYNEMLDKGLEKQSGAMGYLALLRNLNTMLKEADVNVDTLVNLLTNQEAILKSKVFPFQILTAMYYLLDRKYGYTYNSKVNEVFTALNKALELSVPNAKPLEGKTLIALDTSVSMDGRALNIAALFAAIFAKTDPNAGILTFGSTAQYENVNTLDSLMTIANVLKTNLGGTDMSTIFRKANKYYDNIIILTDNESWLGDTDTAVTNYINRYGRPKIYTIQFEAYGTNQIKKGLNTTFAGYNDKVFELISNAKSGASLVSEIEKVVL